ncbi:UDP-N-acetylmuramoyl-tripeptide--D-alanyl-D-alanine ligase [Bacteroidota bacterium]
MIENLYNIFLNSSGVSTDTRSIRKNELFFALHGENFNGNQFVEIALEKGCSFVIADDPIYKDHQKVLVVENTLKILQNLANYHRRQWKGRLLAITGSNGKTTTKELVSAVLSKKYTMVATEGNLNNHIGVPLTLLRLKNEDLAIVEMGANHPGEIRLLCEIADPDVGIITNLGKAHLEGFGGPEGVEKAKGELYDHLGAENGIALVNMSEPRLSEMAKIRGLKLFSYGLNADYDVKGIINQSVPRISGAFSYKEESYSIESQLFGNYNFMNILSAAAVGVFFDVDPHDILKAIENYHPDNNRSQIVKGKTNTLILDAYNANPTSMKFAIDEFCMRDSRKKMLILGDMHELGDYTVAEHENILQILMGKGIQDIILVGDYFSHFSQDARFPFKYFSTVNDCIAYLAEYCPTDYHILLKGSRRNSLEKATKLLLDC